MKKGFVSLLVVIITITLVSSFAQRTLTKLVVPPPVVKKTIPKSIDTPKHVIDTTIAFPLEKDHVYSVYNYIIDLRREKIIKKYEPLFLRNDYNFTGYTWMGVLEHIIQSCPDKEIADNTFVKTQGEIICFTITRYKAVAKFPAFICPILADTKLFEHYIKTADRNKIHDF